MHFLLLLVLLSMSRKLCYIIGTAVIVLGNLDMANKRLLTMISVELMSSTFITDRDSAIIIM